METRSLKALSALRLQGNQRGNYKETLSFPQKKSRETFLMGDKRRNTLEVVADAILEKAVIDISQGGIWQDTPEVEAFEDEINCLYRALLEGLCTIQAFTEIVNQWKSAGTQITNH
jgi:hypothetical protein